MLVQLARAYGAPPGLPSGQLRPNHTILFLSTDGGAYGGLGAAWFAKHSPMSSRRRPPSSTSTPSAARVRLAIELHGDTPRTPSGTLLRDGAARVAAADGPRARAAERCCDQLVDLGFPFSLYEQAPFLAQGIAADHAHDRRRHGRPIRPATPSERLERAAPRASSARSAQDLARHPRRGARVRPGNVELRLPRLAPDPRLGGRARADRVPACRSSPRPIDLFARCRRRRIPLAPALRSYRSRLVFWIWVVGLFELFGSLGAWPDGAARPLAPRSAAAARLAAQGLLALAVLAWPAGSSPGSGCSRAGR